jgi:hypothetical protein
MLLEIKETKRRPMAGALQVGPDIDAEWQVQTAPNSAETAYRTTMALANDRMARRESGRRTNQRRPRDGTHAAIVWWVIAPSSATATSP